MALESAYAKEPDQSEYCTELLTLHKGRTPLHGNLQPYRESVMPSAATAGATGESGARITEMRVEDKTAAKRRRNAGPCDNVR